MKLKDLKVDKPFKAYLFIKEANVRDAKNNSKFIRLVLSDPEYREVVGYIWNAQPEDIEEYASGKIVGIQGKGKDFQGNLQLDIQRIRPVNMGDKVKIEDFVESAPLSSDAMFDEIESTVSAFSSEDLKKLILKAVDEKRDKLSYFPAAKSVHHAMRSGLLYHTVSMMRLGKEIVKLYPFLDQDLLMAGIILHDMGKVDELQSSEIGVVDDYTTRGKLLGHIAIQLADLDRLGKELGTNEELLMLLEHMILSHHYEPEYGSPVKPMFPEAELLHHIDMIDARMNTMKKITNQLEPGQFSEKNFFLDNIRIYKKKEY